MKTLPIFACILMLVTATGTLAQNQPITIDANASQLSWTGYAEVGSWAPTGTIHLLKGQLTRVGSQINSATITMDMTTIQHENDRLQAHLRDEAFFDVIHFPTATFALRSLTGTTATGQLTVKGVTRSISFPVVVSEENNGLRLKGRALIDRTQFGIRYNSTSFFADLGDQAIKNEFSLSFDLITKPIMKAARQRTAR
ncbi:YceI family protein [Spirosoma pollinicola]|uniref:Lipid/polyisoprenoid-binding YceI-like domain-containing protein n=1 Tax=Spirosoma pollinicola TaxID=2057025 RepID=A0A2K8YRX8_9BACT|nr:YceI family protein [Spirosoma pollinicola]AUD00377.1 hypothetical protein CWM47_00210 [Spirosoma pollinicola]